MTAPSIPQDDADSIDLDVLLALTEKYGLENAAQWQQTYSRLHMVSFDDLDIDNLEENVAIELVQLLRALPRLIRYAKKIKEVAFFGPFNAEDIEL